VKVPLAAIALVASCAPPEIQTETPIAAKLYERDKADWVPVEASPVNSPDGAAYPSGTRVLLLRKISAESTDLAIRVELLGTARDRELGELVEAQIRLENARAGARYEIRVEPTRDAVTILPARRFLVSGRERVRVQFTSFSDGLAGIRVRCRKVSVSHFERPAQSEPR
jgi:hypothetical protein